MAVNIPNDAGFRLDMSVNQHFAALNRSETRERHPPSREMYTELFSTQFDESMKLHSGEYNEDKQLESDGTSSRAFVFQ
jgi:hypothetical protein